MKMEFWIVECPSIPGCVIRAKLRKKALKNIKDALGLCLEVAPKGALSG